MATIQDQNALQCKSDAVMPSTFENISSAQLYEMLAQEATVITSNQRLSRFRLETFEDIQVQQDKHAWHTPQILSWSAWLQQQWSTFGDSPWLNVQQESLLWRDCIALDSEVEVLNPKALSKQAMEAWKILADYQIETSCLEQGGEEHTALLRWGALLSQKTSHILQHQIIPSLINVQRKHQHNTFILDGFDTFTPIQLQFLNHLQTLGSVIYEVRHHLPPAILKLSVYQDDDHELRQVCQNIRTHIQQHPQHKIGVLIPDLERRAKTISRIFSEELAPELSLQTNAELQGGYFNISLGSTLGKQPMIQSAFAILALTIKAQLQSPNITHLLLSPYILGYNDEVNQRASLDATFKKNNQSQLSLKQFLETLDKEEVALPAFQGFLSLISSYANQPNAKDQHHMSYWVSYAEEILTQLLWHKQASENNASEAAQVQNWHDLMVQLTSLDDFYGEMCWSEAIAHIQEYAYEQLFRPAPGHAAVQIMGLLEAANLRFDHAFIVGMDDITWPQAAKPNPLIPFDIQVLHQTPHANSEREWLYAQAVWQNTQYVSPTLDVSYAKSKDKQEVQPSPLLQELGEFTEIESHTSFRFAASLQQQHIDTESIQEKLQPISAEEVVKGGTGILKAQSACAFQAFAKYRLHLQGIDTPTLGLNPAEQGTLLHAALENFWLEAKSQQTLSKLIETEELEHVIQTCVQKAWGNLHRLVPFAIKHLEDIRLQQLLYQWLMAENERLPFQVVASEVWRNIKLGTKQALHLHTKLDRIDSDQQGKHIILDYKTGKTSARKTLGERPDEPQIAAYYLAEIQQNKTVDALAFAQVRSDEMKFQGFAQEDDILPHVSKPKGRRTEPQDWNELTSEWQKALDRLADEFMDGASNVAPKQTQSCLYCSFSGLCRIKTV